MNVQTVLTACDAVQRRLDRCWEFRRSCALPWRTHRPAPVSTINPLYAYSYVVGEQWSGALLRRSTRQASLGGSLPRRAAASTTARTGRVALHRRLCLISA